jgi:hypothetical protein
MSSKNIYTQILTSISLKNKYYKWYINIINYAAARASTKKEAKKIIIDVETHHIVPECFFKHRSRKGSIGFLSENPNDKLNLVHLTPKEHFICHKLLTKMFSDHKMQVKMTEAISAFLMNKSGKRILNSNQYDYIRKLNYETIKYKIDNKLYHTQTAEWRSNLSKSMTGEKHHRFGKPQTTEWKNNKAEANRKYYKCIDPSNIEHITKNLKQFCKENKLQYTAMISVATKKYPQHRGWLCEKFNPLI